MVTNHIYSVNDSNFEEEVMDSNMPVVVNFSNESEPCRRFRRTFWQIATDFQGQMKAANIDISQNPVTSKKYGITSVPTLIVFNSGTIKGTLTDKLSHDDVVHFLVEAGV